MSLQYFLYGGTHALGGYLPEVGGQQVGQAGNCIEVLVPDVLLGEHALGYLAAVACGPELCQAVEYLPVAQSSVRRSSIFWSSAGVMVSSPRLPPL